MDAIKALYSPGRREVACVLIQAACGGDRRACNLVSDWCVTLQDDYVMVTASVEEWRAIGKMAKEQRPGPDHFARQQQC